MYQIPSFYQPKLPMFGGGYIGQIGGGSPYKPSGLAAGAGALGAIFQALAYNKEKQKQEARETIKGLWSMGVREGPVFQSALAKVYGALTLPKRRTPQEIAGGAPPGYGVQITQEEPGGGTVTYAPESEIRPQMLRGEKVYSQYNPQTRQWEETKVKAPVSSKSEQPPKFYKGTDAWYRLDYPYTGEAIKTNIPATVDLEKQQARETVKNLLSMGIREGPAFQSAFTKAYGEGVTLPKRPSPQESLDRIAQILQGEYEPPSLGVDFETGQLKTGYYRPKKQLPENYKVDLENAISAIDRGANAEKVCQRIAAVYPERSAEVRRILVFTPAGERLEMLKQALFGD